ncbi:MAG: 2-dehydropantoate 2-reductase [Thermoplasmata archaeon]|nr:2-dehydropantoate 2-reductase [Thermoplasmata archaeon]
MARILIVGPGAIGTVLAVRLAVAGHAVSVLPRPGTPPGTFPDRFRIEGIVPAEAPVTLLEGPVLPGSADAAVLAVKGFDLTTAAIRLAPLGSVPILLVQNGLGVAERAADGLRSAGVPGEAPSLVPAVQSVPTTRLGPGIARQAGVGEVLLAAASSPGASEGTDRWADWLTGAGIPVRRVADFPREVWRKLLINAAMNPVTADHGVENGRLAVDPWRGQARTLLREARQVAAAEGFEFTEAESERDLFRVIRATAANRSSMLQDVERHRRTEIDSISGAILALGEAWGLALPATRRIVDRIRRRSPPEPADVP